MDVNVISEAMTDFKNYKKNLPEDRSKNIVFSKIGYDNEQCKLYFITIWKMLKSSGAKIIDVDLFYNRKNVGIINHDRSGEYYFGGGIELFQCKAEFKVDYDE